MSDAALRVDDLTLVRASDGTRLVDDFNLEIGRGRVCALVGESGSGKTLISRLVIGLLPPGVSRLQGRAWLDDVELTALGSHQWRAVRGVRIGMVFQEPMVSLNPAMRIGPQMVEALRLHRGVSRSEARASAIEMLRRFRVADPETCLLRHPHEFSGGMRQRILLAGVMLLRPALLLADEPTTALDAIVQKDVLDDMVGVAHEQGTSVLLVTHDLGVVGRYADEVAVINQGKLEERGSADEVLNRPRAEYTNRLLDAIPARRPPPLSRRQTEQTLVEVDGLSVDYPGAKIGLFGRGVPKRVVNEVSFTIAPGEFVGLVGESGSGKTTVGRAVLKLVPAAGGRIAYRGQDITSLSEQQMKPLRPKLQLVFQDPFSSLNPRHRVGRIVTAGLIGLSAAERAERALRLLEDVGLAPDFAERFPHQLSGGQRQRVSIARALALDPDLLVADEPVSALDVTVQSQILDLLDGLREQRGFGCLFISHDLAVVQAVCDRVIVMQGGQVVETGATGRVMAAPEHPYTRRLIDAFPTLGERSMLPNSQGEKP